MSLVLIIGSELIPLVFQQRGIYTFAMITQLITTTLDRAHSSDCAVPSKASDRLRQSLERFKNRLQIGSRQKNASPQFQTLTLKRGDAQRWASN